MTRVNNLFSPGNPDMFHANYTVTLTFLSRLEGMRKGTKVRENAGMIENMKRKME